MTDQRITGDLASNVDTCEREMARGNQRTPLALCTTVRLASEAYNETPTRDLKRSPCEIFTKTAVMPEPKLWRPFGCPVYVLDAALQSAGGIKHKWEK